MNFRDASRASDVYQFSCKMDFSRFYNLNRKLLLFVGLCPYTKSKLTCVQNVYMLSLFGFALLFEVFFPFVHLFSTSRNLGNFMQSEFIALMII